MTLEEQILKLSLYIVFCGDPAVYMHHYFTNESPWQHYLEQIKENQVTREPM